MSASVLKLRLFSRYLQATYRTWVFRVTGQGSLSPNFPSLTHIDSLKEYIFIIFSLVKFSNYLSLSTISGNKRVILFSIFYFLTSGLITSQSTFSDIINNIPLSYLLIRCCPMCANSQYRVVFFT